MNPLQQPLFVGSPVIEGQHRRGVLTDHHVRVDGRDGDAGVADPWFLVEDPLRDDAPQEVLSRAEILRRAIANSGRK